MQDRLVLGIPRLGHTRVRLADKWYKLEDVPDKAVLLSPCGGSALTLSCKDSVTVMRCNPVGWLTGQNWVGPNNAYAMTHRVLDALVEQDLVKWSPQVREAISNDEVNFHELAFAQYADLGTHLERFSDLLKSCYGAVAQHLNPKHPVHIHLFQGPGLILRDRVSTLTMYSKYLKTFEEDPRYSHHIVDTLAESLRTHMRIETTVKYNWFAKRRSLAAWRNADWDTVQAELFQNFLGDRFYLDYITRCPNVFTPNYASGWPKADRKLFSEWQAGRIPDARAIRRMKLRHGFNAGLSFVGHKNLLWTLFRPDCVRVPTRVDLSDVRTTVGHKLFAQHAPLIDQLTSGANPRIMRKINGLCGI